MPTFVNMPTTLTYIMILFIIADFIFEEILDHKNHARWKLPIPGIFKDLYQEDEYQKAKNYPQENMLLVIFLIGDK
jgi:hypothetical protein